MGDLTVLLQSDVVRREISRGLREGTLVWGILEALPYDSIRGPDDLLQLLSLLCPRFRPSIKSSPENTLTDSVSAVLVEEPLPAVEEEVVEAVETEAVLEEHEEVKEFPVEGNPEEDALFHAEPLDELIEEEIVDDEDDGEEVDFKISIPVPPRRKHTSERPKRTKEWYVEPPRTSKFAFALPEDVFLPRERDEGKGERALMRAILHDALEICRDYKNAVSRREQRLWREAWEWISSDDTFYTHSFLNICTILNFNPDWIRRKVQILWGSGSSHNAVYRRRKRSYLT